MSTVPAYIQQPSIVLANRIPLTLILLFSRGRFVLRFGRCRTADLPAERAGARQHHGAAAQRLACPGTSPLVHHDGDPVHLPPSSE